MMWSVFQISVSVRDRGLPSPRTASTNAVVTVTVLRNENPPIFFSQSYEVSLSENVAIGTSVLEITASDADINVCTFKL